MCKAIVSSGLETELRRVTKADTYDVSYVKQLIHSYSSIGIPIILIISAHNTPENRLNKKFPHHAVTVTGFKDSTLPQRPRQDTVYLRSESITKLYVHDDQWGPFARMEFGVNGKVTSHWDSLYLGYTNIETVIIPIYPKIRIAYDDIKEVVFSIDNLLFEAYTQIECDFEWEIGLELSEVYKNFIRNFNLAEKDKFEFLVKSCPRYIWRASCYYKGSRTIDFIFDATDISANRIVIHSIFFSKDVKKYLREFFDKEKNRYKELFKNEKYYEFIVSSVNVD